MQESWFEYAKESEPQGKYRSRRPSSWLYCPAYRRIALEASKLRTLGFTLASIARRLGVNDKAVAKALALLGPAVLPSGCRPADE